jgi:hypothetical protein
LVGLQGLSMPSGAADESMTAIAIALLASPQPDTIALDGARGGAIFHRNSDQKQWSTDWGGSGECIISSVDSNRGIISGSFRFTATDSLGKSQVIVEDGEFRLKMRSAAPVGKAGMWGAWWDAHMVRLTERRHGAPRAIAQL